ncbi:MipA/OmpV family protein [Acuticoccus mangrovi]|uniref:MipA/OmpV family protein n=1 Tax=Acuticoccus mangrovi TaxID=2796142 RepID=A0A934IFF6_9HYPH|nr:MipA/OmpV family protein [Acuticoccus mangrovi]MBJ3775654.1 MipA/OmpV family protein [Acuticoccus mangrovi]
MIASSSHVVRCCSVSIGALFAVALWGPPTASASDLFSQSLQDDTKDDVAELSRLQRLRQRLHDWDTVVGAGAKISPEYEGSDNLSISPIPYVSMTFFDRVTVDPTGVVGKLYEAGPFTLSAKVGYEDGLTEDDADELEGLGDVDFGATVGGRISAAFGAVTIYGDVEKTLGGSDGLLGVAGVDVSYAVRPWLRLGAGASATFADQNHMEAYFGVDRSQSARSGYPVYKPDAGLKRLDLTATATVAFNEHWFVRGEAGLGFLVGDAADSPIVKDELQPSAMLVLGYRF